MPPASAGIRSGWQKGAHFIDSNTKVWICLFRSGLVDEDADAATKEGP